jgi:hypothetical protein
MDLETSEFPVAGANFAITLKAFRGKAHIEVYVNDQLTVERDCDDPPCHEVIFLTRDLAGRTLRVLATAEGQSEDKVLTIGMKGSEGGAMMAH